MGPADLMMRLGQGEIAAQFEAGVWFYPSGDNDDDRMVETLSHCAASIVLVPGPSKDAATRRPGLVQCFERAASGLFDCLHSVRKTLLA